MYTGNGSVTVRAPTGVWDEPRAPGARPVALASSHSGSTPRGHRVSLFPSSPRVTARAGDSLWLLGPGFNSVFPGHLEVPLHLKFTIPENVIIRFPYKPTPYFSVPS